MATSPEARPDVTARLAAFLGEWSLEARFPGQAGPGPVGRTVFEWALDGQYLVQRTEIPHPDAPDRLWIFAADDDGSYTAHYFDSRGVARLDAMTVADRAWTLQRDQPDFSPLPFAQRFLARFGDDGASIEGEWQTSDDGTTWRHDFDLLDTRRG